MNFLFPSQTSSHRPSLVLSGLLSPFSGILFLFLLVFSSPLQISIQAAPQSSVLGSPGSSVYVAPGSQGVAAPHNAAASSDSVSSTTVRFFSQALGREVTYLTFTPTPLDPAKRYPVVYLLHGAWGSHLDWSSKREKFLSALLGKPLIVVTPDGGQFGWYLDSPITPNSNYETFMTKDLINDVDARFPTLSKREGRGIAGLSMGGHGALSLAARHPDLYVSASSMSGILRLENHPGKWELDKRLGKLPAALEEWKKHSVYNLADKFASNSIALLIDCGVSDTGTGAITDARQVHERLANRGINHTYLELPGDHNWEYWRSRLEPHLKFHESVFEDWASGKPPKTGRKAKERWSDHYIERALAFERENAEKWSRPGAPRPIVLLGSSSFELMKAEKLMPGYSIANRGISADTIGLHSRGVSHRLECSVFDCRPRAVFILNGRNDLAATAKSGKPTVEEVAARFGEVVKRIRKGAPETWIFVVSDLPVRDKYSNMAPLLPRYNALLREIAESNGAQKIKDPKNSKDAQAPRDSKIRYVDVYPDLSGPDGLLKKEYSSDGLHINKAGYEIVGRRFVETLTAAGLPPQ